MAVRTEQREALASRFYGLLANRQMALKVGSAEG
ncbi:hypothetical protein AjGTCBM29_00749 [Aeromonas jandaei]|nr:hypothetical protein AjGTCBM29_00749 [Aeromonas jandaei]